MLRGDLCLYLCLYLSQINFYPYSPINSFGYKIYFNNWFWIPSNLLVVRTSVLWIPGWSGQSWGEKNPIAPLGDAVSRPEPPPETWQIPYCKTRGMDEAARGSKCLSFLLLLLSWCSLLHTVRCSVYSLSSYTLLWMIILYFAYTMDFPLGLREYNSQFHIRSFKAHYVNIIFCFFIEPFSADHSGRAV
jgi:hypothetical protein